MVLALTTLARVKQVLERQQAAAVPDANITEIILAVSDRAEQYLQREIQTKARTEIYPLPPNRTWLSLKAYPIVSVASVKYSNDDDFTDVDALDTSDYSIRANLGQIRFRNSAIAPQWARGFVEVVYTGGMAVDADAFLAAYPGAEFAVREEVINRLNRSKNPEGNVQAFNTGVAYLKAVEPMADFWKALDPLRRIRLGAA